MRLSPSAATRTSWWSARVRNVYPLLEAAIAGYEGREHRVAFPHDPSEPGIDRMICHQYETLFIHIPKCAGQSVEQTFLSSLGLRWETRAPLLMRPNDRPELGPPRLAHLHAVDYVRYKYMSELQFSKYGKFCFVRNPWDRTVSFYKYLRYQRYCDFNYFVKRILCQTLVRDQKWFYGPQADFFLNEDGNVVVDYIGRFETLEEDFQTVRQMFNLPLADLPHVNKSRSEAWLPVFSVKNVPYFAFYWLTGKRIRNAADYRDFYDEESKRVVARIYEKDIDFLKYTFDGTEVPPGVGRETAVGRARRARFIREGCH